ncbi:MAG: hypothetical protein CISAcid_06200 [uncultured Acidilobus sp. CIS]|nr:MAG: hypothetical protein CISAcid_06200 [uncultured Acidilobus sp. CIS]
MSFIFIPLRGLGQRETGGALIIVLSEGKTFSIMKAGKL